MKKTKLIGLLAGVTALAVGANATYAWLTSTGEPVGLAVDVATIAVAGDEVTEVLENKLPGEQVGFQDWEFTNNSSRESIVRFSLTALDITLAGGVQFETGRKEQLLALFNQPNNLNIVGVESGGNPLYKDANGYLYLWLDANDQLDTGMFSITFAIPEELGGNVGTYDIDGILTGRTIDRQNEHGAIIKLGCQAYAVQATEAAITDVFGTTVADYFF